MFFKLTSTCIVIPALIWLIFGFSNLHWHYAVHVFDLFIPVIGLKMLRFKFSVLFGTHASLDKSLIVLRLQAHLSNLTETG